MNYGYKPEDDKEPIGFGGWVFIGAVLVYEYWRWFLGAAGICAIYLWLLS